MSAMHPEVFHITQTLNWMANDMPPDGSDFDWLRELERLLL